MTLLFYAGGVRERYGVMRLFGVWRPRVPELAGRSYKMPQSKVDLRAEG